LRVGSRLMWRRSSPVVVLMIRVSRSLMRGMMGVPEWVRPMPIGGGGRRGGGIWRRWCRCGRGGRGGGGRRRCRGGWSWEQPVDDGGGGAG
jgi:hypothetical protein